MNDREVESALDAELMLIVKLLAAVYPQGCGDVVVIPAGCYALPVKKCKKSVIKLTFVNIVNQIYKLIYMLGG